MAETTVVRQAPAEFIEAAGKNYLEDLTSAVGGIKGLDVSKLYGPQFVAGPESISNTTAETLAGGLGGYQPYLQAAQAATGPQAYQQYMSPYQQDVIDTSLREYDIQAQKGLPGLAAQAIGAGAFGGGREGVQRAEYQAASDRNRAALLAQLLQQGFGQAQQLAGQQFGQQMQSSSTNTCFVRTTTRFVLYIRCTTTSTRTSKITSTTKLSLPTSISTITSCTNFRFRCYGINIWIPRIKLKHKLLLHLAHYKLV
jgi:hypothetical protein